MSANDKTNRFYEEEIWPDNVDSDIDHATIVKVKIPLRVRLNFLSMLQHYGISQKTFFYMCMRDAIYNTNSMREIVHRHKLREGTIKKEEIIFENEQVAAGEKIEKNIFSEEDLASIFSILEEDDRTFKS